MIKSTIQPSVDRLLLLSRTPKFRIYVSIGGIFLLFLFIAYLSSSTSESIEVNTVLMKAEKDWEGKDEINQFDSVRNPKYEDPEIELGDTTSETISSGEGGIPQLEQELESEIVAKKDPYARICGSQVSARALRPGVRNSKVAVQYVHIPKAGGMSVQHAMEQWVKPAGLRYFRHDGTTVAGSSSTCPGAAMNHDVFTGHRGYGFCEGVIRKRNPFIFTVFREPVSRMISLYDYNLKSRHTDRAQQSFGGKSLSQWVVHFNSTPQVEHGEFLLKYSGSQQARFMCGFDCLGPAGRSKTEEMLLQKALENLRDRVHTRAIGYLENFDDVLDQLRVHLRWVPKNAVWPHSNALKPTAKSKLDEQSNEIMKKWAWVDVRLYEEAVKMADQMTLEARECIRKVEEWKSGNKDDAVESD
jgi:hypothetical protein